MMPEMKKTAKKPKKRNRGNRSNLKNHNLIKPEIVDDIQKSDKGIKTAVSPLSWNVIRIGNMRL
jgi:hypothetical protein